MSMKIILTDSLKACPVEEIESTFTDIRFVEVSPRKLATITSKDNVIAVIGSRALVQKCANIDLTKCKFIQLFSTYIKMLFSFFNRVILLDVKFF